MEAREQELKHPAARTSMGKYISKNVSSRRKLGMMLRDTLSLVSYKFLTVAIRSADAVVS